MNMKTGFLSLMIATLSFLSFSLDATASVQGEIRYLLKYGKKIIIEGTRPGEQRWDKACRLKRKSNYVAIVQRDGANYRIVPVPEGKPIEKLCPEDVFQNALRWYENLHYRREAHE